MSAIYNINDPNNSSQTNSSVVKGFGYLNTGSLGNETTGVSDGGLPYVLKAFPSWEKKDGSKLTGKLNADEVYKNNEFISLETNGILYKNINSWKNGSESNVVIASVFKNHKNKLVDPITNGEYSPSPKKLFKTGKELDGSKWGLEKGKVRETPNNKIFFKKRYE